MPKTANDRRLDALLERIQAGDCVLVLGPRIAAPVDVAGPDVCMADDLARRLQEDLGVAEPERIGLLRIIGRYERERSPQACRSLVQSFIADYGGHPTPLHIDLAHLPFRLILASTPDRLIAEALRVAGKKDVVEAYYNYYPGAGDNSPLTLPTVDRPIVYSLFGRHDHPESMVLNELNLLDYLVSVTREKPALPDAVRATLRAPSTVFLFIGFGFENWWLRLLLKVLQITGVDNRGMSLALEEQRAFDDGSLAENKGFFESAGIYIVPGSWGDMARDLRARLPAAQAAQPAATPAAAAAQPPRGAPMVFLSYASDDVEAIDRIRQGLAVRGLTVWQDKTNLRAGDRWQEQIEQIIKRVDFFLFVQTPHMDRRDAALEDGVYNRELALALDRRLDRPPGVPFVVHVTVGACAPPRKSLKDLHHIAVDDDAGLDRLAVDLLAAIGAGSVP